MRSLAETAVAGNLPATDQSSDVSHRTDSCAGCICTQAGWCERHQCHKTHYWHMLCRLDPLYFALWEQGKDPRQEPPPRREPGLLQKAVHFGQAVVRHAADGFQAVEEATFAARIAVCEGCVSLDRERRVCQEKTCGCFVDRKARWASEDCPLKKWPLSEPTSDAAPPSEAAPANESSSSPSP